MNALLIANNDKQNEIIFCDNKGFLMTDRLFLGACAYAWQVAPPLSWRVLSVLGDGPRLVWTRISHAAARRTRVFCSDCENEMNKRADNALNQRKVFPIEFTQNAKESERSPCCRYCRAVIVWLTARSTKKIVSLA